MTGKGLGGNRPAVALQAAKADGGDGQGSATPARDTELRRMAAFRVRETANRIATLANNAQNEALRQELLSICQRLMQEERALLEATGSPRDN
jgi:hypothetical protein